MSSNSRSPAFRAPWMLIFLAVGASFAAAQSSPQSIGASAPSTTSIALVWRDTPDEEKYRIERDGAVVADNVAADSNTFTDDGLTANTTYVYRVGAVKNGAVAWSKKAWTRTTAQTEFWVVSGLAEADYRVGYNYCEYFKGYDPTDYHFGVDAMRVGDNATGQKTVVAPLAGRIDLSNGAGADQNLEIALGGQHYLLSHLQNCVVTAADAGGWMMAGVVVGEVGNNAFGAYGAHVHCNRDVNLYNFATPDAKNMRHFLMLYSANALRDPGGKLPQILDAQKPSNLDADDDAIQFKADGAGAYFTDKTSAAPPAPQPANAYIVRGKVDIVAEAQDDMNHPAKPAALFKIGYWIKALGAAGHNVQSETQPYVLHKCDPNLFDGAVDHTKDVYETVGKEVVYNTSWTVCHHYVVTNTKGTTGAIGDVDAAQHWNTVAKSINGGSANGVGNGDAAKAQDAYFPDGPYRVFVQASDLVQTLVFLQSPPSYADVWVENFPPAVTDHHGALDVAPSGEQVCSAVVTFSEPMNRASVDAAIRIRDISGNIVQFTTKWRADGMQVSIIPNGFVGYLYRVKIDASVAKDLCGGASGTGAFLDGAFGDANHNGTSEGDPVDSVGFDVTCAG